jgi:hypothetical protein
MKIDRIFSFLVPKDRKFFPLFVETANNLVFASDLLVKLVSETDLVKIEELIKKIKEAELIGDAITRRLLQELNGTFITPFDREDIHELINTMDDVVDYIYSASKRVHFYKLSSFPVEFLWIAELIHEANKEIQFILSHVNSINDFKEHKGSCKKIRQMESKVDDIYQEYLARLFDEEVNAIDLIKKRDILTTLEKAIDKCDDISNIFSSLIVKMS